MRHIGRATARIANWKIWSLAASAASGLVIVISFLVPSVQEQMDRYEARQVVQGYVRVGKGLLKDKKYELAEDAFARAFELSNNQRLDIEILRLKARIDQVNDEGVWAQPLKSKLEEVDFIHFIYLSEQSGDASQRSVAHASYALFLASKRRFSESKSHLETALRLDSQNYDAHVDMANVLMESKELDAAQAELLKAIDIDPRRYIAHYNLGLLDLERGRQADAISRLTRAFELNPSPEIKALLTDAQKSSRVAPRRLESRTGH